MESEQIQYRRIPGCVVRRGRFYVCRRNPPVSIVDQPRFGFVTMQEGWDWLASRLSVTSLDLFIVVPAEAIE